MTRRPAGRAAACGSTTASTRLSTTRSSTAGSATRSSGRTRSPGNPDGASPPSGRSRRAGDAPRPGAHHMATTIGFTPHVAPRRDDARDLIAALRGRAEAIRREELRRLDGRWDGLSADDRGRLEALTQSIVEALLRE